MDYRILDSLISKVANRDLKALEELYDYTFESVYAFALSILKNKHDAEDVSQDVYLNIYKHADKYLSVKKPLAWIITITKNLSYNKMNKKKYEVNMDNTFIESVVSNLTNVEDKLYIEAIFEYLEDTERQIIILHELNGFKYIEISSLLNINISTVISKYHRAIKKIRSKFKKGDEVHG